MKRIIKNSPPASLKKWLDGQKGINCSYQNDLPTEIKEEIKESLLNEQGYLCCYTGKKIDKSESHIEHLKPQKISRQNNDQDDVNYQNMLAAFPRDFTEKDRGTGKRFVTECPYGAQKRASWYDEQLFVTPLQPDCEQRFKFDLKGNIFPTNPKDEAAEKTIEELGLKHEYLVADRETAIFEFLFTEELSKKQVENLHEKIMERNNRGQFRAFCLVLKQACELYLKKLERKHNAKVAIQRHKNRR